MAKNTACRVLGTLPVFRVDWRAEFRFRKPHTHRPAAPGRAHPCVAGKVDVNLLALALRKPACAPSPCRNEPSADGTAGTMWLSNYSNRTLQPIAIASVPWRGPTADRGLPCLAAQITSTPVAAAAAALEVPQDGALAVEWREEVSLAVAVAVLCAPREAPGCSHCGYRNFQFQQLISADHHHRTQTHNATGSRTSCELVVPSADRRRRHHLAKRNCLDRAGTWECTWLTWCAPGACVRACMFAHRSALRSACCAPFIRRMSEKYFNQRIAVPGGHLVALNGRSQPAIGDIDGPRTRWRGRKGNPNRSLEWFNKSPSLSRSRMVGRSASQPAAANKPNSSSTSTGGHTASAER